ncbi:MAG: DEAD/DEAH box helicase [Cyclobacteriaceae bacterium]|nr:DEAD/DEAH box helicase [Cyclobacteriaceae bacterium]
MNTFSKLGLSDTTVSVLQQMGFETPTPIQEEAIPILLENNPTDFIGLAQTGTGKTAAFGLPLIDLIDESNPATQVLIMAPTRELTQQTAKQLVEFASNNRKINVEVVYGGASIMGQIKALKRSTQIVVATPGRLLDLIKRKAIKLDDIRYVVLDEADEMLNMGFIDDIDEILSYTHDERVTWLFSATMPPAVRKIVKKYMDSPKEVSVFAGDKSNKDISHKYIITKTSNKLPAIRRFMDIQPDMRGIMFCRTKRETQEIADQLGEKGYGVEALHGDLSQAQRDAVMRRFKTRSMQLLIATDVAARGIDVNDLTHVFHHTLPDQIESYTHRSGRTGRAGKKGISLALINSRENRRITEIERRLNVSFEKVEVPSIEELKYSRVNNWANLIINTKVDDQAEEVLNHLHGQFAHLSKEDILKRLITTQLDHLMIQEGEDSNLNESGNDRKRDSRDGRERRDGRDGRDSRERRDSRDGRESREERTPRKGRSGFNRYFINIGTIDGMTKADLIHFISDNSDVPRNSFGDVNMQKNFAFFEVDDKQDRGLAEKFTGMDIEGRELRVNLDDESNKKNKTVSSSGGGGEFRGRKSSFRDRPRGDSGSRSGGGPGGFRKRRRN